MSIDTDRVKLAVVFTTLIILLLVAGIAIIVIITSRQRIKRAIAFEKELRTVELEVSESILTNLSMELHDNIGQMLTATHWELKKQQVKNPEIKPLLIPVNDMVNEVIEQVKILSRGLNSEMVQNNGLKKNIAQQIERLKRLEKFEVNYNEGDTEVQLSDDIQLIVFRIFQEVVNNIMKHSGATVVNIKLAGNPFFLQVVDNGIGFNLESLDKSKKGMGVNNIIKRSKMSGLICEIDSSVGKGCIFILKQP